MGRMLSAVLLDKGQICKHKRVHIKHKAGMDCIISLDRNIYREPENRFGY